jgi:hypothetical protein
MSKYQVEIPGLERTHAGPACEALGVFLSQRVSEGGNVSIFGWVDERIGGVRLSEISITRGAPGGGIVGGSYQRDDAGGGAAVFAAESFLLTHGTTVEWPLGWSEPLNLHGESRCRLLEAMGCKELVAAEWEMVRREEDELKRERSSLCSVRGKPQFNTPSGVSCPDGHGVASTQEPPPSGSVT